MSQWTRREVLRSGMLASAGVSLVPSAAKASAVTPAPLPALFAFGPEAAASMGRQRASLDAGWKFHLGNSDDPVKDFGFGVAARERSYAKSGKVSAVTSDGFDDAAWRTVNLPHDWAVELPFVGTMPQPEQGGRALGREYPETSVGWYRRSFALTAEDAPRRIWIEFDGVMRAADIFINGHYLAPHFSGYAPVRFDVTDWMNFGGQNLLVVRCDVSLGEGWFYEGAGIYRHVWLSKVPALFLAHDGSFAYTQLQAGRRQLVLQAELTNDSDTERHGQVVWELVDAEGKTAATHAAAPVIVPAWSTVTSYGKTLVPTPHLWSCEDPYCYTLRTRLVERTATADTTTDATESTFGIRDLRFDADQGFFLNDKPVKVKGTCNHQDHAGVGAALPDALHGWRLQRLKEMGCNAVRTSHNCPAPEWIEAADRMGMLVLCETRMMDSNAEGLAQLTVMVRRYRNHPSIFLWSLGNEEPEQGTARGVRIVSTMKRTARRLDPSRLTTVAMNAEQGKGITNVVDVQGFNYNEESIDEVHRRFPKLPILGTETASTLATRGEYSKNEAAGYVSAYDRNVPEWGKTAEAWWKFYDARPFLIGGFVWTGFDYRGEPTPYSWPCVSSHFGVLDVCGFPKDTYFYYKAWWSTEPVLHLFPHWNWMPGDKVDVWCHTNMDSVELLLNGRSLGRKDVAKNTHLAWDAVVFEAGTLEARGYKAGKLAMTVQRETAGAPANLMLQCDRKHLQADGRDAAVVLVSLTDAQGRVAPLAAEPITFKVSGKGALIGLGNGDPSSHEPDKGTVRSAFNGLCTAIVQAAAEPGELVIEAMSPGLKTGRLTLTVAG